MLKTRPLLGLLVLVLLTAGARATEATAAPGHDELVYKDGDRVRGHLVRHENGVIVFQSDRFGELRVPETAAVVIPAEAAHAGAKHPAAATPPAALASAPAPVPPAPAAPAAEAETESVWEHFAPAVLAARFREYFGPWHGKLAFSSEVVSDSASRGAVSVETQLHRKWTADEVKLQGRYDYSETAGKATTDVLKGDAQIRHEFSARSFVLYHPSIEWNQASYKNGVPSDYVVLQQEFGTGYTVLNAPARKLRLGVSENQFDTWTILPTDPHSSRSLQSTFVESEVKVPWGMKLTDRAVYYYSFTSQEDGWENQVELSKKFTETFSTSIRHELRRGGSDINVQDYTRLKLLLGVEF